MKQKTACFRGYLRVFGHASFKGRFVRRCLPVATERRALPPTSGSLADSYTDGLAQPAQGVFDR